VAATSTDLPVAEGWFSRATLDHGVTLVTEPHVDPFLRANVFVVDCGEAVLVVDGGCGICSLGAEIADLVAGRPVTSVATHAHYDHVGSLHDFSIRLIHPAEAESMATGGDFATLRGTDFDEAFHEMAQRIGYRVPDLLVDAVPYAGFDIDAYAIVPTVATGTLVEGDTLLVGSRSFLVLHTPGHSPGGLSLLERETGMLIAGDAVYDGPLIDDDVEVYRATIERLRALDVTVVHGGHEASFGQARLREICDAWLAAHPT
jgi:glyoxylase-like metal-dependent hydrolase (beta-lactamase superfamily II)